MSWQSFNVGTNSLTRIVPVAALACDPFKELLWVGSSDGQMSCMYHPSLEYRVRVQAHARGHSILALTPFEQGILSASSAGCRFHSRGGVLQLEYDTRSFYEHITAAAIASEHALASEIVLAGMNTGDEDQTKNGLAMMDISTNQMIVHASTQSSTVALGCGRIIACGTSSSSLTLHDPRSLSRVQSLIGHIGGSHRILVKGDRLISIGYVIPPSTQNYGRLDSIVKIYDLRNYRPLPPVLASLSGGPIDAAFMPLFSSTLALVELGGMWRIVDCEGADSQAAESDQVYQVPLGSDGIGGGGETVTCMTLSTSGDVIYFGDSSGGVCGWSDKVPPVTDDNADVVPSLDGVRMNAYSAPASYVLPNVDPAPISMSEDTPLTFAAKDIAVAAQDKKVQEEEKEEDSDTKSEDNDRDSPSPPAISASINQSLSHLPRYTNFIPPSTPPIDEKLLHMAYHIKFQEHIGVIDASSVQRGLMPGGGAHYPGARGGAHKNKSHEVHLFQPNHLPTIHKYAAKGRPIDRLFRKKMLPRNAANAATGKKNSYITSSSSSSSSLSTSSLISKEYARVTIKIPRFGLYAFDFSQYNRTHFTGLDNFLPNSYCNPIIQMLYFTPLIKEAMTLHLCERENCLTCELGFLFHMLSNRRGNCIEPRNFLRALRLLPEVSGLGLLDMNDNIVSATAAKMIKDGTSSNPTSQQQQMLLEKQAQSKSFFHQNHFRSRNMMNQNNNALTAATAAHTSSTPSSSATSASASSAPYDDDEELFLSPKIQDFFRFLLEQLHKEEYEAKLFMIQYQLQHPYHPNQIDSPSHANNPHAAMASIAFKLYREKCYQSSQLQYIYQSTHQRRERNTTLILQQLQTNFIQLQNQIQNQASQIGNNQQQMGLQSTAAGTPTPSQQYDALLHSLPTQLSYFLHQSQSLSSEYDTAEYESYVRQLQELEEEKYKLSKSTLIETVFGTKIEQRIRCNGTHHASSHELIQEKINFHVKLNYAPNASLIHATGGAGGGTSNNPYASSSSQYYTTSTNNPSYSSTLDSGLAPTTFDHILTNSLYDGNGTQRLYCGKCNNFTIQSQTKCVKLATNQNHPQQQQQQQQHQNNYSPPISSFSSSLTIMANVTTDVQWELWQSKDERFVHLYENEHAIANKLRKHQQQQHMQQKNTNLFNAFNAAGGSSIAEGDESSSASDPSYELKSGVINAPPSLSSTPSSSTLDPYASLREEMSDVNFLPHFMLLYISTPNTPSTGNSSSSASDPITYAYRIRRSVAHELSSLLQQYYILQSNYYSQKKTLDANMIQTRIASIQFQQTYNVCTQQHFLIQTKLQALMIYQQYLVQTFHTMQQVNLSQQSQQQQMQQQSQLNSLQVNLQSIAQQIVSLQSQKLNLQNKMNTMNMSGASIGSGSGSSTPTNASANAAANSAPPNSNIGLAGFQSKLQQLQYDHQENETSYQSCTQEYAQKIKMLIKQHLQQDARMGISSYLFNADTLTNTSLNDIALYELQTVIAHIADPPEKDSPLHSINGEHLIAHIKVDSQVYDKNESDTNAEKEREKKLNSARSRYAPSVLASPNTPTTLPVAVTASEARDNWHVFNDFVIRPSNGSQSTRFDYVWKQPSLVVYKLMNTMKKDEVQSTIHNPATMSVSPRHGNMNTNFANNDAASTASSSTSIIRTTSPSPLPPSIPFQSRTPPPLSAQSTTQINPFLHDSILYSYPASLSQRYNDRTKTFQPLIPSGPNRDVMDATSLVAIDCEFVSVQPELCDIDQETHETVIVRPARLTLARVSVIRGSGQSAFTPFLDNYILTNEPVIDYLTKYSGISPGDLDRASSQHYLTTMKSVYMRLRSLIERGVKFIGHGLKADLQMLNLIIPSSQVYDTVDLFSLPNQRKLSLKFLAKYLLNLQVQMHNHDSIEDARTALHLFRKYCELKQTNQLTATLQQLYETGHREGFKVE